MEDTRQEEPVEVSVYGPRSETLRECVEKAVPFRNTNRNLVGFRGRHHTIGRLNEIEGALYLEREDEITFTVVSFDTPIAWLYEDGTAHFVGQYFSPTTSRHLAAVQGLGKAVGQ